MGPAGVEGGGAVVGARVGLLVGVGAVDRATDGVGLEGTDGGADPGVVAVTVGAGTELPQPAITSRSTSARRRTFIAGLTIACFVSFNDSHTREAMTQRRRDWLAFLEETVGFLALVVVALVRSRDTDRWPTFALLVAAYVAGLVIATSVLERRLPFARHPAKAEPAMGGDRRGSAALEIGAALVAFAALTVAFDRGALPPSVQWLGVAVVAAAAWTIGRGVAGVVTLAPRSGA